VNGLLSDPATVFVLVASPRADTVEEALFFADKLHEAGIDVDALVVNRLHPRFGANGDAGGERERASTLSGTGLGTLYANLADFREVSAREESHFADLAAKVAPAPVGRVPFLADDVHDLDGLTAVGSHLF
jgi:anion-transporting  ArsA/GET3 family ATPase